MLSAFEMFTKDLTAREDLTHHVDLLMGPYTAINAHMKPRADRDTHILEYCNELHMHAEFILIL